MKEKSNHKLLIQKFFTDPKTLKKAKRGNLKTTYIWQYVLTHPKYFLLVKNTKHHKTHLLKKKNKIRAMLDKQNIVYQTRILIQGFARDKKEIN